LISFVATCAYGIQDVFGMEGVPHTISYAMWYTWYGNGYAWQYFVVPIATSLGAVIFCIAIGYVLTEVLHFAKPIVGPTEILKRILAKLGIEDQEPKDKEELASEPDKSSDQQELMQPAAADSVIIEEVPAEN
jgi:hypothetical protein